MDSAESTQSYKHREPDRGRGRDCERERERERYNRMVQGQACRDRRRYMALSPTRLQSRSPRLQYQYIHRGRANLLFTTSPKNSITASPISNHAPSPTFPPVSFCPAPILIPSMSSTSTSSVSAISPDTEPMFQMSPVPARCLPPLRNAEPINVMTLRNCAGPPRSRLRAKSNRAAVPPLLYTFPRPNPNSNSNPISKPRKQNSNSQLTSLKKPFGLTPQNHIQKHFRSYRPEASAEDSSDSELEMSSPPPSLFLDLSLTPHPPPRLLPPSGNKHIRIAPNYTQDEKEVELSQNPRTSPKRKKTRARTPMPSPKIRDVPKPVLTSITVSRTVRHSLSLSSLPSNSAPLHHIPSLPIPIPYHTPRDEDTGLFEDIDVSQDDDDGIDPLNGIVVRTNSSKKADDARASQTNCLGLELPFSPIPDTSPNPDPSLKIYPARSSNPVLDRDCSQNYDYPCTDQSISSSLSPQLGFGSEEKHWSCTSPHHSPVVAVDDHAPVIDADVNPVYSDSNSDGGIEKAPGIWTHRGMHTRRNRRSKEIDQVEYFGNAMEEDGTSVDVEPDSFASPSFVPTSQRFDSPEPVFPAFSIAQDAYLGFGNGIDQSRSHIQGSDVVLDGVRTSDLDESSDLITTDRGINPWASAFSSSNSSPSSMSSGSDTGTNSTFRARFPLTLKEPTWHKYRNGIADLNVFNPPSMPAFGGETDSRSVSGSSGSDSDSESSEPGSKSGSLSRNSLTRPQFLSFPIPIFNPDSPYAVTTAVTNVLVPLPASPESDMPYRSPVYNERPRNNVRAVEDIDQLPGREVQPEFQSSDLASNLFQNGAGSAGEASFVPSRSPEANEPESQTFPISPELQHPHFLVEQTTRNPTKGQGQERKRKEAYSGLLKRFVGLKAGIGRDGKTGKIF